MNLTSWRRYRTFMADSSGPMADDHANRRRFIIMVPVISNRIETHLDRSLQLTSYTEYFDTINGRYEYWVKGRPISSITSVESDSTGLYTGSESAESGYYAGVNNNSVVLDVPVTPAKKGLCIVYTGGLASHGTRSQFVLSSEGGTAIAAGKYVEGRTSQALGYVTAKSGTAITIEVLYGVFEEDEIVDGKASEDGDVISNMYATLDSVTSRCLAETYPDIVLACEIEMRYYEKHKSDFENDSTSKGNTVRRDLTTNYDLLPETRNLLQPYRRYAL